MKRYILLVAVCFVGYIGHSQVGIGNTDPKSSLDISASSGATPSNTDGILIPRIDNFPSSDPGADQDGMLVFVTGNGTPTRGFYFWDNGAMSWVLVSGAGSNDSDWFITGTSNPSTAITDNLVTQGSVTVGTDLNGFPNTKFFVKSDVTSDIYPVRINPEGTPASSATIYGIYNTDASLTPSAAFNYQALYNNFSSTHIGSATGLYNNFSASGGSETGVYNRFNGISGMYGMRNEFIGSTSSSAGFFGIENRFLSSTTYDGIIYGFNNTIQAAGNGARYGLFNSISGSGSGNKYGVYTNISASAGGQHYGLYSDVQNASGYAGYFIGRSSFGTDPSTGRYLLPAADGTAGQILTTDGSGQLGFTDPVSEDIDWYEVGSTSAPNAITDNMFTQGNVVIGATTNPANVKFYVESDPSTTTTGIRQSMGAASSGLLRGIDNDLTANGTTNVYAISNSIGGNSTGLSIQAIRNSFSGSGGRKTGMYNLFSFGFGGQARGMENEFNNSGILSAMGIYNSFLDLNAAGYGYGTYNTASGGVSAISLFGSYTSFSGATVSGSAYGNYARVETSGTDYAIYGHSTDNSIDYAGYFIGRASFGTDASIGRYVLPSSDGTSGQVITTNGSGILSFSTISGFEWTDGGSYLTPVDGITKEVLIGTTTSGNGKLLVSSGTKNAAIEADFNGSADYGVLTTRTGSTTGLKYGVYNDIGGASSNFSSWGTYNSVTTAGDGSRIAIYNTVNSPGSGNKFATWNYIPSTDPGTHYGIYSDVQNVSGYAGYFIGRSSFGNTSSNRYIMPASDGTAGQMIVTDGAGQLSFSNPPADTDDQTVDTFGLVGNNLGISLEDDGQPVQTVDLSNVNFNVSNFAMAKITMSANQSLLASTATKLNFDTVVYDLGSNFDAVNDRFVVSEDGYYRIAVSTNTNGNDTTTNLFQIYIGAPSVVKRDYRSHHGNGYIARYVETIEYLTAGDTIEVYAFGQTPWTISSNTQYTTLEIERIR